MSAVVTFVNIALILVLISAAGIILWHIISVRRLPILICLFLILPVGQLLMLYSFSFDEWSVFWLVGLLFGLAANVLLLIYTISQEKKTELEEELRETRHRMELEQTHYQAVEQRREELTKIRRDFNNRLVSAARLVRSGEDVPARELIRSLSEEINDTNENPYCVIPVVNAILTEKAGECESAGIGFYVELDIPARLSVEQMHLCSIFGNMMDNAIAACKHVDAADPTIQLSSKVDGDYLFIKAVNPSAEPPKKPLPGHGYGTRILSDLAARYSGNYQSEYRDGMFAAVVSLLAVD